MSSTPASPSQGVLVRRALALAGCGVLTVTLPACESTEQESAKIAREGQHVSAPGGSLALGAVNHSVHVADVTLLSAAGRTAVAMRLTGTSTHAQAAVPVLLEVSGAGGKLLYSNSTGGLEASLQHAPLLPAGKDVWWVNDQVLTSQTATGVRARIGTGVTRHGSAGALLPVAGVHVTQQAGASVVAATVANPSGTAEEKVPVFAVALRGGRVVAAGRAVIESLPARSHDTSLQIFLVGDPSGATIELTAAPTAT